MNPPLNYNILVFNYHKKIPLINMNFTNFRLRVYKSHLALAIIRKTPYWDINVITF